ncbi:WD domain G-beta repeat domain-containing protein [Phytophthora infestans]|uniref:Eukaryotic translation initiation factor 3 subunit I n=1 Tax=Phytophthora infestans TaxID=4787 RepID=A0A8S9UQV8_PHYIN|nr:WD domain G-beta repeat domain-containing protein [Phytophthora infestans]
MRPILLKGHSRSLTMIKYNREGDLLFSCAKDHTPNLWYSDTGERIGTYVGHSGAVWACDVSYHSERLLTAAADATVKLWDVQNGEELFSFPHTGPARSVNFSTGDKYFVSVADKFSDRPAAVYVYELADDVANQSAEPVLTITNHGHEGRITGAYWMPLNKAIMTTGGDGTIKLFDPKTGQLLESHVIHTGEITNVAFNKSKTLAITSSKDNTAKLLDVETLKVLKVYETDRPVNSAAISPIKEHVVLGGGQEAMSVTTTSGRVGKFEARFFHMVFQEEFGRVKGHFGPINTIAFHPNGKSYASGAEDGYVRLHHFDNDYLKLDALK